MFPFRNNNNDNDNPDDLSPEQVMERLTAEVKRRAQKARLERRVMLGLNILITGAALGAMLSDRFDVASTLLLAMLIGETIETRQVVSRVAQAEAHIHATETSRKVEAMFAGLMDALDDEGGPRVAMVQLTDEGPVVRVPVKKKGEDGDGDDDDRDFPGLYL